MHAERLSVAFGIAARQRCLLHEHMICSNMKSCCMLRALCRLCLACAAPTALLPIACCCLEVLAASNVLIHGQLGWQLLAAGGCKRATDL